MFRGTFRAHSMSDYQAQDRRMAAEHEAAHAVVARALGARVGLVELRADGSGRTCFDGVESRSDRIAIAMAAEVWLHVFRTLEYPLGDRTGCAEDHRDLELVLRAGDLEQNGAFTRLIPLLESRRSEIIDLASQLVEHGQVDLSRG